MGREAPSNSDDIIDSRSIIKRIDELQADRQDLIDAVEDAEEEVNERGKVRAAAMADADGDRESAERADEDLYDAQQALKDAKIDLLQWTGNLGEVDAGDLVAPSDEARELKILEDLQDECSYGDWVHGETLIADSYFQTYAQELAEDIGAIPKDLSWPACHIDWDAAANALKMDYHEVDFDGVAYQIRS